MGQIVLSPSVSVAVVRDDSGTIQNDESFPPYIRAYAHCTNKNTRYERSYFLIKIIVELTIKVCLKGLDGLKFLKGLNCAGQDIHDSVLFVTLDTVIQSHSLVSSFLTSEGFTMSILGVVIPRLPSNVIIEGKFPPLVVFRLLSANGNGSITLFMLNLHKSDVVTVSLAGDLYDKTVDQYILTPHGGNNITAT